MPKRGNAYAVGVFVVGAIALLVVGALVLGGSRWLHGDLRFVLNFREAVTGLGVGSPVDFRGVKIGEVVDIRALYEPASGTFYFPVDIAIEPSRFERLGPGDKALSGQEVAMALVAKGLRARLETRSFVTGQKRIALDFYPDKAPVYGGPEAAGSRSELPTVPSQTEDIANLLRQVPFEQLGKDLVEIVAGLKAMVGPGSDGSVQPLADLVADLRKAVAGLERDLPPVLNESRAALAELRQALARAGPVLTGAEDALKSVAGAATSIEQTSTDTRAAVMLAQSTIKELNAGVAQARAALANVERLTSDDSGAMYEVTRAAAELRTAARAIRSLADELQARPDALLRGRPREDKR